MTDWSDNADHAIQATASKQPVFKTNIVNGEPVFRFDGSTDYIDLGDVTF